MAWDQGYYDPSQAWWPNNQDPYADPYGYNYGYEQEDPEEVKKRKEEEAKARREALESNRLYLKKVNRQCVKEDFGNLERHQLFLVEILVEYLEVDSTGTLGLAPEGPDDNCTVSARAQFLNSPFLEIYSKETDDQEGGSSESIFKGTPYFDTLGQAGMNDAVDTHRVRITEDSFSSVEKKEVSFARSSEGSKGPLVEEPNIDTRWNQATGKSCLFSMSVMEMIRGLRQYPVVLQVLRRVEEKKKTSETSLPSLAEGKPEAIEPLGYARLRLPDEFSLSVLQSCKPGVLLPVSCVHRDTCDIRNLFGVKKGRAEVFVRLSSFGPVIVTSFHTEGDDRRYVFKPSPLSEEDDNEEHKIPQGESLKPILAEEVDIIGITTQKDLDTFHKQVIWQNSKDLSTLEDDLPKKYKCKRDFKGKDFGEPSPFSSDSDVQIPFDKDIDMCRNVLPRTIYKNVKQFEKFCDWHDLVGTEVVNSLTGNCGCLEEPVGCKLHGQLKIPIRLQNQDKLDLKPVISEYGHPCPTLRDGQRYEMSKDSIPKQAPSYCGCPCPKIRDKLDEMKMQPKVEPLTKLEPIVGVGLKPDPSSCFCDCPRIREKLLYKKLYGQ